jgi:uncharacterized protein (TIGR03435 family)
MHLRRTFTLLAAASFALAAPTHAQSPAPPTTAATAPPTFDIVSIKPANPAAIGSGTRIQGNTFTATNVTLNRLIQYQAYGIPGPQIIGIPPALDKVAFDIQAKFDPSIIRQAQPPLPRQYTVPQLMFQQLLADKFKLIVHTETRQLPAYALVLAKGGVTLQPAKDPNSESSSSGTGNLKAKGITSADLAKMLTQVLSDELGRLVIDRTNLTGKYDLTLKWTPSMGQPPMLNGQPDTSAPDIFTAVQEQLGLKLESTKAPVPVLVIDHAELPSEN